MRCLQHVLWRGALALALLGSGSAGAWLVPPPDAGACRATDSSTTAPLDADAAWTAAAPRAMAWPAAAAGRHALGPRRRAQG